MAFHEAGHTTAYLRFGYTVLTASLLPSSDPALLNCIAYVLAGERRCFGVVQRSARPMALEGVHLAAIHLAGPAGEVLAGLLTPLQARARWRGRQWVADVANATECLATVPQAQRPSLDTLFAYTLEDLRAPRRWATVERIADALMEHHTIDGAMIDQLVTPVVMMPTHGNVRPLNDLDDAIGILLDCPQPGERPDDPRWRVQLREGEQPTQERLTYDETVARLRTHAAERGVHAWIEEYRFDWRPLAHLKDAVA